MRTTTRPTKDPDVFKCLAICDPHFAASSPPAFKTNYLEYLESNVDQVFRYAIKNKVDAILWAGDIFHLKEPRNNPLWLVARVISRLSVPQVVEGIPNLGIGGNHDYKYGTLEAGLRGSPLEVLVASGIYHILDDHEYLFQGNGFSVRVAGGSYHHGQAQHVRDKKKDGADWLITLGHFWLGKQTGEFFGEALYGFDFFKDSESDIYIVGHHHEDKGVMEMDGKTYVSHGSISVTGAHPHDLTRRPGAAYIEIRKEGKDIKLLRVKQPEIGEILDLDRHQQIKEEKKEMQEFIESLAQTEIAVSDPQQILNELAPTAQIRQRAQEYIELAESNL